MAKSIDEALALFASGKSPRECEKLTRIPATTIIRKAKEQGIVKGSVAHLVQDIARVSAEFGAQNGAVKEVIKSEVAKQLEGMQFYSTLTRKVVESGTDSFLAEPSPIAMKPVLDAMKAGMQIEGLVPFYPNAPQVNTQVNTTETQDKRRVFHVVE